jgi:chorismate-pyruvate lyase
MTPTLEAFHGERIHLRVLGRWQEGDTYRREVALVLNGREQPVEFGAIVINLQHFPPAAREEILEGYRPLGTILATHNIERVSRPQAFLRVTSDDVMNEALQLDGTRVLYGRRNVLLDANGNVLADVVEILPLVKGDGVME